MKTDVDQYEKKKMWDNFFIFEIFMSRDWAKPLSHRAKILSQVIQDPSLWVT